MVLAGLIALALLVTLAGCDELNEPVIEHDNPSPLDAGFVTYEHPTGVFSLRMPPDWIPQELLDYSGVRVQFSALRDGREITWLSVYVVNTGDPRTPEAFAQKVADYLPPDDLATYAWEEFERTAQDDLSHRITGVRTYPQLGPRVLNIFLQQDGVFFSALELDLTDATPAALDTLRAVVNTYRVNADAKLEVGTVQQAAAGVTSQTGVVGFNGYLAWTDSQGVFHISGEAVNTTRQSLEALVLTGVLFDAQGRRLQEQSDILSVDVLPPCPAVPCQPGEGAPFDLRFEGGRPPAAVRYELDVVARPAGQTARVFYGPENFSVIRDPATYNDRGQLIVRGELANTGPHTATAVKVVATIWDDQGHVVGTNTVFVRQDAIVPAESVAFEVPFGELGGPAALYTLKVSGMIGE